MATKTSNNKIIPADAPKPDEGGFWVIYGRGGVGKTSSACLATGALLLDCTGAGRFQHVDTWRILGPADLEEALAYLKTPGHPYRVAILDSPDDLYQRSLPPLKDERAKHKAAQAIILPLFAQFWSLPIHRILIVNEKRSDREVAVMEEGERVRKVLRDIEMNLPPKLNQLVDDRADVIMRAENSGRLDPATNAPMPTRVRIRRITDSDINIQAKTRLDTLTNGMELIHALHALGVIVESAAQSQAA